MKIGVWVTEPVSKISGGSFTYSDALFAGIDNFPFSKDVEVIFISLENVSGFTKQYINLKPHQRSASFFVKVIRRIFKLVSKKIFKGVIDSIDRFEKIKKDKSITGYLKKHDVKVIFYPMPASNVINGIPYILNNWDLAHYSTYAFPEILDDNGFKRRNSWYTEIMTDALFVCSETQAGKKEMAHYLNFNPDKIKVLPIFSSNIFINKQLVAGTQLDILNKMGLKAQQFFFYPAQFWAHKNHYNLIKAFQRFRQHFTDFKLVFCGSDKGNLSHIKNVVETLQLNESVLFCGFIEDDELFTLYKNANALIMPTLLGPSNIPPIEALFLNCPVLCSDLEGHREIMNDAALYFDPLNDASILDSMVAIVNEATRLQIINNQQQLSTTTPHTIEKALIRLDSIFFEASNLRNCWG